MVENLSISNFKSVADLQFKAKRINLFLGEPNSGKSNILEALSVFSAIHTSGLQNVIRLKRIIDLFTDNNIYEPVTFVADSYVATISYDKLGSVLVLSVDGKEYTLLLEPSGKFKPYLKSNIDTIDEFETEQPFIFKPYVFRVINSFKNREETFLYPPYGDNLPEVLRTNPNVRESAAAVFKSRGYKLNLNLERSEINMLKEVDDVVYTYPYKSISDTLQRITFYLAAVDSNRDSVLIFEEPEANTFPYYTKFMAERIALDQNNNQYFIATHNPYLLLSIVEKTKIEDLAVNIVYLKNHQTKIKQLSDEEFSMLLDLESDVFFNLDKFFEE